MADIPITFEESTIIREKFTKDFKLREFSLEESQEIQEAMSGDTVDLDAIVDCDTNLAGVDELVHHMLKGIDTKHINNDMLTTIYADLKVDHD